MPSWNIEKQNWDVSDADLDAMVTEGAQHTAELRKQGELVVLAAARYLQEERRVRADLTNGTTFIFPVDQVQGLAEASDNMLANVEVWGAEMLVWPGLDVHVSATSLMSGIFGSSVWMSELQRQRGMKGGSSRSTAKADAARLNGRLGGRPRKSAP